VKFYIELVKPAIAIDAPPSLPSGNIAAGPVIRSICLEMLHMYDTGRLNLR
jgi:hypothetical protein